MKSALTLILGSFIALSNAQEPEPPIPPAAVNTALQWMQNSDPAKRAAAYRTFQLFGDAGRDTYRDTLSKARDLHEKRMGQLLADESKNPFLEFNEIADTLKTERERIFALIHTDYHKDATEIRKLLDEVEDLSKLNLKARKLAVAKSEEFDALMMVLGTSMAEVEREIKIADREELESDTLDPGATLKECYEGGVYLETKGRVAKIREEIDSLAKAKTDNDAAAWANGPQKEFTHHLNSFRSLFAITPLILDEQLSAAATGHSQDMASLGFFSHTSPIKDKASPGDRARMAKFKHQWSGENIFMGSSSPISAYGAWFGSDGHRFIMFSKGPNLIGVGPHGNHWTMMTGTR